MKIEILAKREFENVGIQIIKTDGFENTLYLSGEEIGQALRLEDPRIATNKIYQRHKDELEEFSMLWTINTPGGPQEVRIFSEEAVYMITFFSQSKKAKEFRKWVAHLLKAYRQSKLGTGPAAQGYINGLREQRLFLKEQRQFYEAARSEAERINRNRGSLQDLDQVPFPQEGEPTSQNTIRNIWKRLLTKAGLRNMRFHDIRHTFASLLLSKGKSPVYVKDQLGHSSIQMTVDIAVI